MNDGDDADAPIERVETPEGKDLYTFSYESDRIIASLVEVVAWVKGVDPTELEPLYNVIDTTALEELYRSPPEKRPTTTFTYGGCTVQITDDATITVRPQNESLADNLCRPSNALVYDMPNPQYNDEACSDLLSVESYNNENVLYVTFATDSGGSAWNSHPGTRPANLGIVSVDDFARSASTSGASAPGPGYPQIATVPDPADLASLGVRINEFLSAWAENSHQTVVCFQSLGELLAHTNRTAAFEFLYYLTRRIQTTDAVAHYHLDVEALDDRTIATLDRLFDTCIEHDKIDGWTKKSDCPSLR